MGADSHPSWSREPSPFPQASEGPPTAWRQQGRGSSHLPCALNPLPVPNLFAVCSVQPVSLSLTLSDHSQPLCFILHLSRPNQTVPLLTSDTGAVSAALHCKSRAPALCSQQPGHPQVCVGHLSDSLSAALTFFLFLLSPAFPFCSRLPSLAAPAFPLSLPFPLFYLFLPFLLSPPFHYLNSSSAKDKMKAH